MDPAIEKSTERQSALDVAKAAFFAANGSIQHIPRGIGKDSLRPPDVPPPRYGYGRIAPVKSKRGRIITAAEKEALAARLMECKAAGMSRYKASKHLKISETLCRKLIEAHSLDFPASG
ncbi:hypothetical protein PS662_04335 [Pseudomonas fluorescens]|uniref:Uncharacterized protein n=1 Tax=Pseudomonas fluorescens TaxID=294 RepID=A0A5E6VS17_PSEFL|nr:hypothetical protein [Pseudomonas fluorescens]VVN20403.1 hypothetical protein PS662_04335 [Pseudomonas fluorescens]